MSRPISAIAFEAYKLWQKPNFGALPYLKAMMGLSSIDDTYGVEDARSIVLYFLSNASTWRGEDARRIKAELKAML